MQEAAEEEGRAEEADGGPGEEPREEVDEEGGCGAGEPEPLEVSVDGAGGEDAFWSDCECEVSQVDVKGKYICGSLT